MSGEEYEVEVREMQEMNERNNYIEKLLKETVTHLEMYTSGFIPRTNEREAAQKLLHEIKIAMKLIPAPLLYADMTDEEALVEARKRFGDDVKLVNSGTRKVVLGKYDPADRYYEDLGGRLHMARRLR